MNLLYIKTLLNNNNLNSNPYQIRKRIYYIFKTLLNNNNLNSNRYKIRKQIYYYIFNHNCNHNRYVIKEFITEIEKP